MLIKGITVTYLARYRGYDDHKYPKRYIYLRL